MINNMNGDLINTNIMGELQHLYPLKLVINAIVIICVQAVHWDYVGYADEKSWEDAEKSCQDKEGSLVTIFDKDLNWAISKEMRLKGLDSSWLNGKLKRLDWNWAGATPLEDRKALSQGCWLDTPDHVDMPVSKGKVSETPGDCIKLCSGYKYAAIQGDKQCYCGDTYGTLGGADDCSILCTEVAAGNCGGGKWSKSVFAVDGIWDYWFPGDPKTDLDKPLCGALNILRMYLFSSQECSEKESYACSLSKKACDGKNKHDYMTLGDTCLYFGRYKLDWASARDDCARLGGHLLRLPDADAYDGFVNIIDKRKQIKYYVGLSNFDLRWVTGEKFNYTNWQKDGLYLPSNVSETCVQVNSKANFKWATVPCTEARPYICKQAIKTTSATPIATTTTPAVIGTHTNPTDTSRLPITSTFLAVKDESTISTQIPPTSTVPGTSFPLTSRKEFTVTIKTDKVTSVVTEVSRVTSTSNQLTETVTPPNEQTTVSVESTTSIPPTKPISTSQTALTTDSRTSAVHPSTGKSVSPVQTSMLATSRTHTQGGTTMNNIVPSTIAMTTQAMRTSKTPIPGIKNTMVDIPSLTTSKTKDTHTTFVTVTNPTPTGINIDKNKTLTTGFDENRKQNDISQKALIPVVATCAAVVVLSAVGGSIALIYIKIKSQMKVGDIDMKTVYNQKYGERIVIAE